VSDDTANIPARDYFERAQMWAGTGLFLAAALIILGSFLDWVTVDALPDRIPANQAARAEPFNGFDIGDGWWTLGAGVVLLACAVLIVLRPASRYAWWAFVAAIVSGGIAISDYRGIAEVFADWGGIGRGPSAGIGLTLVAAGAFLGLISSVAAIAATPKRDS
jgi:hypothetical protein